MSNLSNPISLLKQEWINTIRSEAAGAEKHGKLTKKQLNLIYDQDWFKMLTPTVYGGKQLSLPDAMQIEEALACADGSMGWVVTMCAGAGWFGAFMDAELAKKVFETEKVCISGSGYATGTAELTKDGYVINGSWKYASGSNDSTALTANCQLVKNGKPVMNSNGNPEIISFLFYSNEVTISDDWNPIGMVATGTNSFAVTNLTVPENRAFKIGAHHRVTSALYHYPFLQFAEATLTINLCGMAFHFMDLCGQIFADSSNADGSAMNKISKQMLLEAHEMLMQKLQTARQKLYYSVDMSWQVCVANKDISASVLYKVSAAALNCSRIVHECVNTLFPYCGLQAADKDSEINRVWRDIKTAGQHTILLSDSI